MIDRTSERAALRRLLGEGAPRLALLTGRRRVGKTYLLTHAFSREEAFLFTASRTTGEINRRQLLVDLARWSGEEVVVEDYPTWRSVFRLLLDLRAPDPLVVVLDEFQYLADSSSGLATVASELNAVWEARRAPRPFVLVLAGSATGTMEGLATGGAPLYGRFDWQCRLAPFSYWHAAEMAPFEDLRARAMAYGIFGGTPRYLALLDASAPLADNVVRLMLDPGGAVRLLVESALDQEEGLGDVFKYQAVLRAIAGGCTQRNEIAQRAGLASDQGLRDRLRRLIDLGYVEERGNVEAPSNAAVRYGIADPAFRFHQRFVEPAASLLARSTPEQVYAAAVAPHLDAYMGREFERIAVEAYDRRTATEGLPLVRAWGRFEGRDRERRSLEIDLVARLVSGAVMTGAVKWEREPIGARVHYDHLAMLRRAADAGQRWAHEALAPGAQLLYVSAAGATDRFHEAVAESGHGALVWSLADLYAS